MFCWVYMDDDMLYVVLPHFFTLLHSQWVVKSHFFQKPIGKLNLYMCTKYHDYWMSEAMTDDTDFLDFASLWAISWPSYHYSWQKKLKIFEKEKNPSKE